MADMQGKSLISRLVLIACLVATAPFGLHAQNIAHRNSAMDLLDNTKVLRTGDRLRYSVAEEREQPVVLFVDDRGYIDIPLLGRMPAQGRTARQLAYDIKASLEIDFFHRATVKLDHSIAKNVRGEVSILGEVRKQGKLRIPADEILYVSDAVLRAGGFSQRADTDAVTLIRPDPTDPTVDLRFIIDVGGIIATGKYEFDMPVEPDDTIIVPKDETGVGNFYITGEVMSPGLYPIPPDAHNFTVSRAINAAGGFTQWADQTKVLLIRGDDSLPEDQRTLEVNVEDIFLRNIRDNDPVIMPDDLIRVDESWLNL